MEQFVFKNALGASITITDDISTHYHIETYDGLTAAEIIPIYSTGYNQIGNSFWGNKMGVRIISITFSVLGTTMLDLYTKRRYLNNIFNPLLGQGVLTYTNDLWSKSITCAVSAMPTPVEKFDELQTFYLELTAQNPLFYDNNISSYKLGDFLGGLKFPIKFDDSIQFATKGSICYINNVGDVFSPITVEFRNNSLNPKLTLDTGEFIEVDTEIGDGEKLIINTAYGDKTATYINSSGVESSAYHLITPDSTFFSLPVGNNQLSFEGDFGTPEVYISYRNWFVGV
jgi:hypothetical protein